LMRHFRSTKVVSRRVLHHADQLPGFIGVHQGEPSALLTYHLRDDELEVVSLHAAIIGQGLGSLLLVAAQERARELRCRRLWMITTNDNEPAIEFYKRMGLRLAAIHHGAIADSRKLKPEIALRGIGDRPIEDEIEFELPLT